MLFYHCTKMAVNVFFVFLLQLKAGIFKCKDVDAESFSKNTKVVK